MNELIVKLYDQALVLESNGDYVAGELDPVKFAELIVRECADIFGREGTGEYQVDGNWIAKTIKQHFGVGE